MRSENLLPSVIKETFQFPPKKSWIRNSSEKVVSLINDHVLKTLFSSSGVGVYLYVLSNSIFIHPVSINVLCSNGYQNVPCSISYTLTQLAHRLWKLEGGVSCLFWASGLCYFTEFQYMYTETVTVLMEQMYTLSWNIQSVSVCSWQSCHLTPRTCHCLWGAGSRRSRRNLATTTLKSNTTHISHTEMRPPLFKIQPYLHWIGYKECLRGSWSQLS